MAMTQASMNHDKDRHKHYDNMLRVFEDMLNREWPQSSSNPPNNHISSKAILAARAHPKNVDMGLSPESSHGVCQVTAISDGTWERS